MPLGGTQDKDYNHISKKNETFEGLFIYFFEENKMFTQQRKGLNPILRRLCHMIYYLGDKSYPCLVGIGLKVKLVS